MKLTDQAWIGIGILVLVFGLMSVNVPPAFSEAMSFEGQMIQGGLLQGKVAKGATVKINGKKVRVSPEGIFLVEIGRASCRERV